MAAAVPCQVDEADQSPAPASADPTEAVSLELSNPIKLDRRMLESLGVEQFDLPAGELAAPVVLAVVGHAMTLQRPAPPRQPTFEPCPSRLPLSDRSARARTMRRSGRIVRRVGAGRRFDEGYRRWWSSAAHASLLGQGLPPEIEPFSFVPSEGMELLAAFLGLDAGRLLVDLGCGRGRPGMWLAQHSGANLVGVDASVVAIGDALQRRPASPRLASAYFQAADVMATGLVDGSADAVVSIDVLQLLDDPAALLGEAARLLKPAGLLVLTTWEGRRRRPRPLPARPGTADRVGGLGSRHRDRTAVMARPSARHLPRGGRRSHLQCG